MKLSLDIGSLCAIFATLNNTNAMNYFKREFSVFKEGTTDEPIIICSVIGQPFDRSKKMQFYIDLGYTIVKQY